jgi:molybdopterin/thiamine biosynthesis adenylyltransferase
LESGGYIFGKIHMNMVAEITVFVDGGPKARRSPASFTGDNEYATQKKRELQDIDPDIRLLGEYHLHPWTSFPKPSGGDLRQLQEVKNNERTWYTIMLVTKTGFNFWDLNRDGEWFAEVPYQILPSNIHLTENRLLDRISKIAHHNILSQKTILIVGLGSGGSVIAKYLGCTGIGRVLLVDVEELEVVNVIRHEGELEDIGKAKTSICKRVIESHNPFTIVETYEVDVIKEVEKLEELVAKSDLIIGSSGSPKVNNILNKFSIEKGIPAVYGGIYEKASGGYILAVNPSKTACFNCLFNLTSKSSFMDRDAVRRYNLSEDELHAQQGLWIDISIPALLLSKVALQLLHGEEPECNLILYNSNFELKKAKVAKRDDCVVCNFEGWIRKQELMDTPQTSKTTIPKLAPQSIFSKLKERLKRIRKAEA